MKKFHFIKKIILGLIVFGVAFFLNTRFNETVYESFVAQIIMYLGILYLSLLFLWNFVRNINFYSKNGVPPDGSRLLKLVHNLCTTFSNKEVIKDITNINEKEKMNIMTFVIYTVFYIAWFIFLSFWLHFVLTLKNSLDDFEINLLRIFIGLVVIVEFSILTAGVSKIIKNSFSLKKEKENKENDDEIESLLENEILFDIRVFRFHSGIFLYLLREIGFLSFAYAYLLLICDFLEKKYSDFYNFTTLIPTYVTAIAAVFIILLPMIIIWIFYKIVNYQRTRIVLRDDVLYYLGGITKIYNGRKYDILADKEYKINYIKKYRVTLFNIKIYGNIEYTKRSGLETTFENRSKLLIPRAFKNEKEIIKYIKEIQKINK